MCVLRVVQIAEHLFSLPEQLDPSSGRDDDAGEHSTQHAAFKLATQHYIPPHLKPYAFWNVFLLQLHFILARRQHFGTLKCIIIETQADSVVVKSNGLKPVLAAIMHPGRLF
jgi:hypothetical protein